MLPTSDQKQESHGKPIDTPNFQNLKIIEHLRRTCQQRTWQWWELAESCGGTCSQKAEKIGD